ncbi:MAG: HAD family hydrolase [Ruminococcus sp.]|nr:HAD family hydrolase [Ruminococcus sp.]
MEKILFISDLDGTLLNSDGKLSDYTINTMNNLIKNGIYFTFATARTIYSAKPITSGLNANVPCILNNGASVYDMQTGEYIRNNYIPQKTAEKILSAFRNNGVYCFVFKFVNDILLTCYDKTTNEIMQKYVDERKGQYEKPFCECDNLADEIDDKVIYINAMGDYETLLPIRNAVAEINGADFAFYKDTYTDSWFLETFSSEASKANGIKFLREKYGFTKVIAFGDNLNDLSMFKEADTKIAIGNAKPELKEKADFMIDTNDNNGVADWIDREVNFKMSYKNVYGTDGYNKYIEEYMYLFDDKYITDTVVYKLSEGFSLREYIYDDKVKKCVLTETVENSGKYTTKVVYEYKQFYDHACSVGIIMYHSNGHRYFPFHIDLYGISYLDIDTMEVYNYIPEGYTHLHPAPMGESFIITDIHYDKESDLIAYDGCYWAAPSDVMVGDFSNPLNFNPHLINLHYIFDPEYVYDDICFKEWKNGRLYVMCDSKTEKSVSVNELKEMINELTDKGEK